MQPYDYFGESALFNSTTRFATVTAETETTVLVMKGSDITDFSSAKFQEVLFRNQHIWAIEKTKYLK